MDKETFEALRNILEFAEKQLKDTAFPQSIEEDAARVQDWIEETEKEFAD